MLEFQGNRMALDADDLAQQQQVARLDSDGCLVRHRARRPEAHSAARHFQGDRLKGRQNRLPKNGHRYFLIDRDTNLFASFHDTLIG